VIYSHGTTGLQVRYYRGDLWPPGEILQREPLNLQVIYSHGTTGLQVRYYRGDLWPPGEVLQREPLAFR
jgi:hypothetical protein